jgi:hypothetical protein
MHAVRLRLGTGSKAKGLSIQGRAVAFVRANVVYAPATGGQWFLNVTIDEAKTCKKENCDIFEKSRSGRTTARAQT